jgi:hypothetical protein
MELGGHMILKSWGRWAIYTRRRRQLRVTIPACPGQRIFMGCRTVVHKAGKSQKHPELLISLHGGKEGG